MQAAPAYTAVAARHTLQRPATIPIKPQKVSWSPNVRLYVQRAFEPDNAVQGIDLPAMQDKLKVVITNAAESGQLETIDWSQYPLPQHLIKEDRDRAAVYGAHDPLLTNINVPIMSSPAGGAYSPGLSSKKRKNGDLEMSDAESRDITPPGKRKNTKGGLEDRLTGKNKNQSKKEKKAEAFRARDLGANAEVLEKRRQRFGVVGSPEPSSFVRSRSPSLETPSSGPLIGTCQKLEKSYFRLTAPPFPETVRPLAVLEKALLHIRTKWKQEHNYSYTCDQLKSLRQDLTVQHIKNELTVKTYEVHARIALEKKDLGEYNQCQTQLRALYKLKLGGKQEEFTAYRILYIIFTCNRSDMNNVLADLTPADKQMPAVQHALKVRAALASGNYHKFFRLYRDAPFLGPYLLDMIIDRERLAAMAAICRTYKPDVSLHFLAQELAFNSDDSDGSDADAGPRQCLDFLCHHGGESFIERKEDGDVRFAAGRATAVFEGARAAAFRGIDAKPRK
ncbi:hypothetical protein LTR08_004869 [Meristemomyces frigidus]|nr:hypothetical protein LTR08_004869 [Meristemomyces frigidus]